MCLIAPISVPCYNLAYAMPHLLLLLTLLLLFKRAFDYVLCYCLYVPLLCAALLFVVAFFFIVDLCFLHFTPCSISLDLSNSILKPMRSIYQMSYWREICYTYLTY